MGESMRLDEFLALHERLMVDESSGIGDPPERRLSDGEPPGKERRRPINGNAPNKGDWRPRYTTDAGIRWLVDYRRWEEAHEIFKRQGKPIDAMLAAWCGNGGGAFPKLQKTLMARIVELTSEGAALIMLIDHLTALEKDNPDNASALDARHAAKLTVKRAGALWRDVAPIVGTKAWT